MLLLMTCLLTLEIAVSIVFPYGYMFISYSMNDKRREAFDN